MAFSLTIFTKISIADVWQGYEYTYEGPLIPLNSQEKEGT